MIKKNLYELSLEALGDDHVPVMIVIDEIDDLVDSQDAVNAPAEGIQQAILAAKQLYDVAQIVDSKTEDGSIPSSVDVHLLEVVLEGIYERLGVVKPKELSMEAMAETTWGERGVRLNESIIKILQAIVEALRRALSHLQAYMRKVFDAAARLEKYAYSELQQVRKLKGNPTQTEYENARVAKAIYHDPQSLEKVYENLFTLVEDASKSAESGFIPAIIRMVDDFTANKDTTALINGFPAEFERTFSHIFEHDPSTSVLDLVDVPEGVEVHSTAMLPGDYYAVIGVPKSVTYLKEFVFTIRRARLEDTYPTTNKVLTIDQMKWFLDSIIKVTSLIRKFDAVERRGGSMVDRLQDAINRMKKVDKDMLINPNRDVLHALASVAPALARGIHQQTFTFALQSFRSLIEHVKRSADFYTESSTTTV